MLSDRPVTGVDEVTQANSITEHQSHSDSSLATGSSEGSLQTTLEERLSFSISPPPPPPPPSSSSSRDRDPASPRPVLCPVPLPIPPPPATPSPRRQQRCGAKPSGASVPLQATRGHQRSQSSCGDSMDPSDNDDAGAMGLATMAGTDTADCGQAGTNSEHLSEALSSLSLSSLRCSGSLAPPLAKKCNSTGSLEQAGAPCRPGEAKTPGSWTVWTPRGTCLPHGRGRWRRGARLGRGVTRGCHQQGAWG
ncbi:WAS/WASL-interacting protein family member 3-like [Alosa alosa]|uniref:WAS/WASL-interacting protein family member 3-like n=1 Tax=Alosa alosa TaxID=278164 RepID=UPI0020150629|nr:WAS/WASL-interacting protein family member 3-like [Alosa alosa]